MTYSIPQKRDNTLNKKTAFNKGITMKITIFQGSARKKGNTAKALAWVEKELTDLGHDVDSIYLHSKNLKGCLTVSNNLR